MLPRFWRLRCLLLAAFAVLASLAFLASRSQANPETVRIVAPGVWFREGDLDQGHSNNIIIEMKDYIIVVDANYPSGARAAMADVKRISSKPVRYVFDTHHHGDHIYGNVLWTQAGATTLAFQGVAEEMKRFEPARWQAAIKEREDVADLHLDGPQPPQRDIHEETFVLSDGSRKVEFRHFGWAHTRGDGFVYLPKEQVLCTGDVVVNGPYNSLDDADIENWPHVLHAAEKLKVKYVLPGHGLPGGRELLTGQEQFLTELFQAVKDGVSSGKNLEELQSSIQLSMAVTPWVGNSLKEQIQAAYLEASEHKRRGEITN